jgi:hypothetical protein
VVAILLLAPALSAEQPYYQIELVPSGKVIALDVPVAKGTILIFHRYPDGTLISLRRTDVRAVMKVSSRAAVATLPNEHAVEIGNLAMQGASSQAGSPNKNRFGPSGGQNRGDGWMYPFGTAPGRRAGWRPPNAVVASPGAVPMPQNQYTGVETASLGDRR